MDVNQRVLVIGATQGTGYQIVNLLLRDGYQMRALARNEAKAKAKLSSAVEIVRGDITKLNTLPRRDEGCGPHHLYSRMDPAPHQRTIDHSDGIRGSEKYAGRR
jgi:NAD(P)-dependent dehydrogenase (short-subunit alcohol dehydrogenase family)